MTKRHLVFDWSKSEASRKDKLYSVVITGLFFALIMGMIEPVLPSKPTEAEVQATVIRLADAQMAKTWALVAEENGPFPGRLEREGEDGGMMFGKEEGVPWWQDYKAELRPFRQEAGVARPLITPKGKREFPAVGAVVAARPVENPATAPLPGRPVLVPYHAEALEWLPEALPGFDVPPAAERTADPPRFLLSLREDGSLAELVPLAGGEDPARQAIEGWLRGIRFKKGEGERWFALRVEFVNRRENEPGTE